MFSHHLSSYKDAILLLTIFPILYAYIHDSFILQLGTCTTIYVTYFFHLPTCLPTVNYLLVLCINDFFILLCFSISSVQCSRSVVSDSSWPHLLKPARFLCSWNSSGKNSGVGCHSFSRGSSWPRSSALLADCLLSEPPGKPRLGNRVGILPNMRSGNWLV